MPIIVDHTNWNANLLSSAAAGYASRVLEQQRERDRVANQAQLDSLATDNNIRQARAIGDYALSTAPQRIQNQVDEAAAMVPIQAAQYRNEINIKSQAAQATADRLRRQRETEWGPMEAQLSKDAPGHVQPWMLALAKGDYLDNGRLERGTYDLLRPRTPKELADEHYLTLEREAKLKALQRADAVPGEAANAYRQLRTGVVGAVPADPQDEVIAKALEGGTLKLNDPAVRARLNMLTPAESTAAMRASGAGASDDRLANAEMRRQVEADPGLVTAKARLRSALTILTHVTNDELALPEQIAAAEERVAKAEEEVKRAHAAAVERLSGKKPETAQPAPAGTGGAMSNDPAYQRGAALLQSLGHSVGR